jgi:hypothetical protein
MARLKVPKVRSFLEYANFVILFVLYVMAVEGIEEDRLNAKELAFIIYALGAMFPRRVEAVAADDSLLARQAGDDPRAWLER